MHLKGSNGSIWSRCKCANLKILQRLKTTSTKTSLLVRHLESYTRVWISNLCSAITTSVRNLISCLVAQKSLPPGKGGGGSNRKEAAFSQDITFVHGPREDISSGWVGEPGVVN